MSWPITYNIATGVGKAGALPVLLAFGTDGMWTNVIVKSMRSTPMIEEIKMEQGSGLTVTDVLLYDGDEIEVTVEDDRSVTWPLSGGTVTLLNPQPNGTYATSELFQVINNNYNVARKSFGERTLMVKKYILITPIQM